MALAARQAVEAFAAWAAEHRWAVGSGAYEVMAQLDPQPQTRTPTLELLRSAG